MCVTPGHSVLSDFALESILKIMNPNYFICILIWGLLIAFPPALFSQDAEPESVSTPSLRLSVGGGYLIGGQFFSESFTYNSGFFAELAVYKPLSSTVNVGVGVGGSFLMRSEQFFPIFISFLGFTKPNQSSNYLLANAGYAPGSSRDYAELAEYRFYGGPMFKAGFGRRFLIGERSLMMGIALNHQWAGGEYRNSTGDRFTERLNFDWLAIELRFFY